MPLPILTTVTLESDVAQAPDAALLVSESGVILFANDGACTLFKYSAGELDGRSLEVLVPHRNRLAHIGHRLRFTDNRRARPMGRGFELLALCKDGSVSGVAPASVRFGNISPRDTIRYGRYEKLPRFVMSALEEDAAVEGLAGRYAAWEPTRGAADASAQ